jgi:hypothetical protein
MDDMIRLVELLRQRNAIDEQIAKLTHRPASTGHIGEYIAARIFKIDLAKSASTKGHDGRFLEGPLAGHTVNVKFYPKRENVLDLPQDAQQMLDELSKYYLVLTGPKSSAGSSQDTHRPLVIEAVFLFEAARLIQELNARTMSKHGRAAKIGIATSVPEEFWYKAEIYPIQRDNTFSLTLDQQRLLSLLR